eukprot:CAMPEP_0114584066 /NCGR_PEP_ID=MMETSP0125-20121206/7784_1 /TAXON_ID=485358 ORGANISM="Aristerostoma sp., Strain ATCC 50986" /NCGR_SAMPLE_ID=MMETSP0125 /ASSEMBLY_ACC=CAM_ASM_000245 /LENGTH=141 /DNA_ID=CAMNT_0001778121 /DNA_START=210 /DNA_END=636 /DNA_ORIENTATION=+
MSVFHPNIVGILDAQPKLKSDSFVNSNYSGISYTVMEYAAEGNLQDFIIDGCVDPDEKLVRTFFKQIINGLQFLHNHDCAHLDLKPTNIVVTADYTLKIVDFDASYSAKDKKIISRGTLKDIYSAGIILFTLLTGFLPYAE